MQLPVASCSSQLSPQQQQVILPVGVEGMSCEETAEILAFQLARCAHARRVAAIFFAGSWIWRSAVLRQHPNGHFTRLARARLFPPKLT